MKIFGCDLKIKSTGLGDRLNREGSEDLTRSLARVNGWGHSETWERGEEGPAKGCSTLNGGLIAPEATRKKLQGWFS